jgi:hypothetical protein
MAIPVDLFVPKDDPVARCGVLRGANCLVAPKRGRGRVDRYSVGLLSQSPHLRRKRPVVQGTWADHPPASHTPSVPGTAVYTGVHYPGDVVIGAVTGAVIGRAMSRLAVRTNIRRHRPGVAADADRQEAT